MASVKLSGELMQEIHQICNTSEKEAIDKESERKVELLTAVVQQM